MKLDAILDAIENAKSKAELRKIYNGTFAGQKPENVIILNRAMTKRWSELTKKETK